MKKFILPSLILVLISFIPILSIIPSTGRVPSYMNLCYFVLSFLIILFTVRRYKFVYSNGVLSFGEAFKYSLKVTFCYAVIASILYLIYAKVNEDSMLKIMTNAWKIEKGNLIETQGYISPSNEKMMGIMLEIISNPYLMSVAKLFNFLFWGLFFSLIAAAIYKNKTENQESF